MSPRGVTPHSASVPSECGVLRASPERPQSVPKTMELQKLSKPLLESLVDVAAALGVVVDTVIRSDGDVLFTGSSQSLWELLKPFAKHLKDTLRHDGDTPLGETLADFQATPGASWDKVARAASDWQALVIEDVDKWIKMTREANEILTTCSVMASAKGGAVAAKRANDLQEKVDNWLKSVENLVAETRKLLIVTDEEKAATALKEYEAKVKAAKNKTREALKAMEDAVVATSEARATEVGAQRAAVAVGLLEDLMTACAKATKMFQELSCTVEDIKDALEGTKKESPNVPKHLETKVAQAEGLCRARASLFTCHLNRIVGETLSSGPGDQTVAKRCQKAKEDIPYLLQKAMSPQ